MAIKEKWIDLFEKAVVIQPHVLEIEEGQKSDFDLKAIKAFPQWDWLRKLLLLN